MKDTVKMTRGVVDNIGYSEDIYFVKKNGNVYSLSRENNYWGVQSEEEWKELKIEENMYEVEEIDVELKDLIDIPSVYDVQDKVDWLKEVFEL